MNAYLARLNPAERRFVIGVALLFFVVINLVWVKPHFSDWGNLKNRLGDARGKLARYETTIRQSSGLQAQVDKMQSEGAEVPPEDQAVQFLRTIQGQAAQSGVGFTGSSRPSTSTNEFFLEQVQTITVVSGEKELVDFLYNLGSGNSLTRVRALSLRPDANRNQLGGSITLIASYQKNLPVRPAAKSGAAQPATPKKK